MQGLKRALDDDFPVPQQSDASRWGQKLVLPALACTLPGRIQQRQKALVSRVPLDGRQACRYHRRQRGLGLATAHRLAELGPS